MIDLESIVIIYTIGLVSSLAIACMLGQYGNQRIGAQIAILSPIWPVTAVVAAAIGLRLLWRTADWKGGPW